MTRYLLDTHVLIWWNEAAPDLSSAARTVIASGAQIHVSPASIYEIEFKIARGRLAPWSISTIALAEAESFLELPISAAHAERAAQLPLIHRDPWDRILAAQAIVEGMIVVTRDRALALLGARTLW